MLEETMLPVVDLGDNMFVTEWFAGINFTVANLVLTRRGKTGICDRKMIQGATTSR